MSINETEFKLHFNTLIPVDQLGEIADLANLLQKQKLNLRLNGRWRFQPASKLDSQVQPALESVAPDSPDQYQRSKNESEPFVF